MLVKDCQLINRYKHIHVSHIIRIHRITFSTHKKCDFFNRFKALHNQHLPHDTYIRELISCGQLRKNKVPVWLGNKIIWPRLRLTHYTRHTCTKFPSEITRNLTYIVPHMNVSSSDQLHTRTQMLLLN